MTAAIASPTSDGLSPPTVQGSPGLLPLHKYLFRFVRNPLSSLPQAAYEERIVVYNNGRAIRIRKALTGLRRSSRAATTAAVGVGPPPRAFVRELNGRREGSDPVMRGA